MLVSDTIKLNDPASDLTGTPDTNLSSKQLPNGNLGDPTLSVRCWLIVRILSVKIGKMREYRETSGNRP